MRAYEIGWKLVNDAVLAPPIARYARSTPPSDGRVPGRTRVGLPLECRRGSARATRSRRERRRPRRLDPTPKSGKDHRERLVQQRPCARVATSSPHEREYEQSNQPRLGRVSWLVDEQLRGRRRVVPAAELELDDRSNLEQGETPEVELQLVADLEALRKPALHQVVRPVLGGADRQVVEPADDLSVNSEPACVIDCRLEGRAGLAVRRGASLQCRPRSRCR